MVIQGLTQPGPFIFFKTVLSRDTFYNAQSCGVRLTAVPLSLELQSLGFPLLQQPLQPANQS